MMMTMMMMMMMTMMTMMTMRMMMMISTNTVLAAWTEQHGHSETALADCLEGVG